jgi:hypothetical protein
MDAQNIAVLLRGGLRPQASGSPAATRATRDLRRRRTHVLRKRAELLAHLHKTHRQDHLPELGQKGAYTATRDRGAARFPDPAVPQSSAGDLALLGHDDQLRRAMELALLTTATQPKAQTLDLRRTVPGSGERLSLLWLYAI